MSADNSNTNEQEMKKKERILYCLDFDGVLCDSVNETFYSGLRACQLLWGNNSNIGHLFEEEEATVELVSKLLRQSDDTNVLLEQVLEDFRHVRPILYVGWESILLIRLLATHNANNRVEVRDKILHFFHSPTRNIDIAVFPFTKEYALQKSIFSEEDYSTAMSKARKSWIAENTNTNDDATSSSSSTSTSTSTSSWIDAHGFYVDACQSVRDYLALKGNTDIYIITTKAKEFALQLLEKQNLVGTVNVNKISNEKSKSESAVLSSSAVFLQESHIYRLGSGPKADVLQLILRVRQEEDETYEYVAVMVEDNIATLDKISNSIVHNFGNQVQPVVASWGYNTHAQLMTVFLNNATISSSSKNNNNKKGVYIVLPPLLESSTPTEKVECSTNKDTTNNKNNDNTVSKAEADAKYCKEKDITGSSLSVVFETSFLS